MGQRLRQARIAAKHRSARAAATRFGWSVSTYAAHENGQNQFDAEQAVQYAKAFVVDASYLLFGEGPKSNHKFVPVYATVGSDARIWGFPGFDDEARIINHIRVREIERDDAKGILVSPGALWPQYRDWDFLIGWDWDDTAKVREGEAVVRLKTGETLLRYMRPGSEPDRFDLETHVSEPIRNAHLAWSMPIRYVVRFRHWISDWENSDIARRMEAYDLKTRNVLT